MRPCLTMKQLTDIQREHMIMIEDHIERYGFPPTLKEIAERRGVSSKATLCNLEALAKKGYISWQHWKPRTIKVLKPLKPMIYRAESDIEELGILTGDMVSAYYDRIIGITRRVEVSSA